MVCVSYLSHGTTCTWDLDRIGAHVWYIALSLQIVESYIIVFVCTILCTCVLFLWLHTVPHMIAFECFRQGI